MTTPSESTIRDNLADNLAVIEPGLQLVDKEHYLKNPIGARGFVDILARDAHGICTIIEIKRSDASAREALHELCKYLALFRSENGLEDHQLRCILVSTTWHELRVPFSEFVRSSQHQVDGYEIEVMPDGTLARAVPVEPVKLPVSTGLFETAHHIMFSSSSEAEASLLTKIWPAAAEAGARACVILTMEYRGDSNAVLWQRAAYVVLGDVPLELRAEMREKLSVDYGEHIDDIEDRQIEEAFGCLMQDAMEHIYEGYEIGYPDKLTAIRHHGWTISKVTRCGTVGSAAAIPDDDLVRVIAGEEGSSVAIYRRISSPRLGMHWSDFIEKSELSLKGNRRWDAGFRSFCGQAEVEAYEASVAISIYNPLCIPLSLFKLFSRGDGDFLPGMEAFAGKSGNSSAMGLIGYVAWDKTRHVSSVDEWLSGICGELQEYLMLLHWSDAWELEEQLMSRLGLSYETVMVAIHGESVTPAEAPDPVAWEEFGAANTELIEDLRTQLEGYAKGL